jgi:hypothetical protein
MKMKHESIVTKAFLAFSCLLALCSLGGCDIVVNEFELSPPDNGTVWVELYNTEDAAVDLDGWVIKIVDEAWEGPIGLQGSIDPRGFLAVDGQESWITTGNGTVYLYDASGVEVDKTPQHGDNEHSDFTYGRQPDGKDTDTRADFGYMMASKGRSNGSGALNQAQ